MKAIELFTVAVPFVLVTMASTGYATSPFGTKVEEAAQEQAQTQHGTIENTGIGQKALFDKTRRGVVTIKVSVVLDKSIYNKQWFGTGFIVDKEKGLIVTNAHVAGELTVASYEIKFGNGKKVEAKLEYSDPCYDFAILSVNPKDIPQYAVPLKVSSDPLALNMEIYSMGNSANNEFSTYKGYIFDTESILWLKPIAEQSFQFSGLTVPGASGSPVLNTNGEVIGLLYGGKFVSGAALPISYVVPAVKTLQEGKKYHRYFCGFMVNYGSVQDFISAGTLPESVLEEYEHKFPDKDKVLYVSRKLTAFEADKSKLEAGDIIWEMDGELIGCNLKKIDEIVQRKQGKSIAMSVYRNGKKEKIDVSTFELTNTTKMKMLSFADAVFHETPHEYKICLGKGKTGVYIADCETSSAFYEVCVAPGNPDVLMAGAQIVSIDGKEISNLDDLADIIPDLCKKKVFTVKFIRIGGDSQVTSLTIKHNPEFAEAKLYTFNADGKNWDVKNLVKK